MSDYISREAAIEAVCRRCKYAFPEDEPCGDCPAKAAILAVPAADVEPVRHGKWNIRVSDERTLCLECSVCGRKVDNFNLHRLLIFGEYGEACRRHPYCHCGAKMDLEDENE